ncbi:MAG: glycosyltransferase family 39 protein [Candidatus Omnitrophica bacterium]|nr:glycosyltransferase family 39 protein [Candidatus Omnitrophota bacterium]
MKNSLQYNKINCSILILLFFISFTIRLVAVLALPQEGSDSGDYIKLARNIRAHRSFSYDGTIPDDSRAPLYPAFIASVFFVCGESLPPIRIIQAGLDALTCLLVFICALILWENVLIAYLGCGIAMIHPSLIGSTTFILSETIATHVITFSLLFLMLAMKRSEKKYYMFSGILLGIGTLGKPICLLFPLFLFMCCCMYKKWRWVLPFFIIFIGSFCITILPWTARNFFQFNKFIPVSSNIGGNLWIGSYEPWGGTYSSEMNALHNRLAVKFDPTIKGHYRIDDYLKKEALKRIKSDPTTYIRLCLGKTVRFWLRIPGEEEILRDRFILKWLIYLSHYTLLCLFVYGLIALCKNGCLAVYHIIPLTIIVYFTLLHAAFSALPRFRIPIIPMVILLSSYGLVHFYRRLRTDKTRRTASAS